MIESIYTIPVNEAFEADCLCPFCYLYSKSEKQTLTQTLGASMMEPDSRIRTNQLGFCTKHYSLLFSSTNKLSLALVLETHLQDVRERLNLCNGNIDALKKTSKKLSLFSKPASVNSAASVLSNTLGAIERTCAVCSVIDATMKRYIDVFFYLWSTDSAFKKKIDAIDGFCLPHYRVLVEKAPDHLKNSQASEFLQLIYHKQQSRLSSLQEDIHKFASKFDYRNANLTWEGVQDAPRRVIETLTGPICDKS